MSVGVVEIKFGALCVLTLGGMHQAVV